MASERPEEARSLD